MSLPETRSSTSSSDLPALLELGFAFHGHRCPAMPLGLRAGLHAMHVLGVSRARDKELHVISETGSGHAAGCFLDGIMVATGCTYGKSNMQKTYLDKLAFTLIHVASQRSVRVSIKPGFMAGMLQSPFVMKRKEGVLPQDINPDVLGPLLDRVLSLEPEDFLAVGPVQTLAFQRPAGVFQARPCSRCGERTFVSGLHETSHGELCGTCRDALDRG